MEEREPDAIEARVAASRTRRGLLGLLAGAAGGVAGLLGLVQAEPGERKRKRQRRRQRRRPRRRKSVDKALYPELRTLPPRELRFAEVNGMHVLRFTNTVWNAGEGRLELQAPTSLIGGELGQLYQNLYDAPVGGKRVGRRQVNGTIFYHENHAHYHFAEFAEYRLLQQDEMGDYGEIGHGSKTSFCIVDSTPVQGSLSRTYLTCERERQGLTPGWGDVYVSSLDEQWVVLGDEPLPAGEYALRSIADPKNLLAEGGGEREGNNAATTYFTVDEGKIVNQRETP
jgi:hypothetical protein